MTDQVEHVELALDDEELARLLGTSVEALARERAGFDLVHKAAANIRAARLHRGLTQKQLAEKLGVTVGRISQYETGDLRHAPSLRVLAEIAHALGMSAGVSLVPDGAGAAVPQAASGGLYAAPHVSHSGVPLTRSEAMDPAVRQRFYAAVDRFLEGRPKETDKPLPASAKAVASGRK
jgi:transcriptional regulator with XRE-family HTH domain